MSLCTNRSIRNSDKLFTFVPKNFKIRKKWMQLDSRKQIYKISFPIYFSVKITLHYFITRSSLISDHLFYSHDPPHNSPRVVLIILLRYSILNLVVLKKTETQLNRFMRPYYRLKLICVFSVVECRFLTSQKS